MPGTTTELTVNAASNSGVVITLEIFFLGLGLTVTDINKTYIKNVKRWHAKKYANKG